MNIFPQIDNVLGNIRTNNVIRIANGGAKSTDGIPTSHLKLVKGILYSFSTNWYETNLNF